MAQTEPGTGDTTRAVVSPGSATDPDEGPSPTAEGTMPSSGDVVGRYRLGARLGAGGMGVVFEAHDPELDRTVALKLVRPARRGDADDASARLLREAQAMAALQHPNVVPVYDVGRSGPHVYLVMERLSGVSLLAWQQAEHPWSEVLEVFRAAGRGLAAAHAKGIVHRDFKPANVIVADDGVFVLDFGLAHSAGQPGAASEGSGRPSTVDPEHGGAEEEASASADRLSAPLTRAGFVMGTPPYMAPEQHEGGRIDARTDQYAFCVALYRALFGVLPYEAKSAEALLQAKRDEQRQPPVRGESVPRTIRAAVERGLSAEPERRHPSMQELLDALQPRAASRRVMAIGGLALGGVGLVVLQQAVAAPSGCDEATLQMLWPDAQRAAAEQAITGAERGYAEETWERVDAAMGGWARSWIAAQERTCNEDTDPADDEILVRLCLSDRRRAFEAAAAVLTEVDGDSLGHAVQVVDSLPVAGGCEVATADGIWSTLPDDPAKRDAIAGLRGRLARAAVLEHLGRHEASITAAREALAEATTIGFVPVIAEAKYQLGSALVFGGQREQGEPLLAEAAHQAEGIGHAAVVVGAAGALTFATGYFDTRHEEAIRWARLGQAHLERLADRGTRAATLLDSLGAVYTARGEPASAEPLHREALEVRLETERAAGKEASIGQAATRNNLGMALYGLGRFDEALEQFEQVVRIREAVLGATHPDVAVAYNNLGNVLMGVGRLEQARQAHGQAMALWNVSMGPEHPHIGTSLHNLGTVALELREYDVAEAHFREAIALRSKILSADNVELATSRLNLGDVLVALERYDEAEPVMRQADGVFTSVLGEEHPYALASRSALAKLRWAKGERAEAIEALRAVLATRQRVMSRTHPEVGKTHQSLATMLEEVGRADEARAQLGHAVVVFEGADANPVDLATARFALAKLELERDPARARSLAEAAAKGLSAAGQAAEALEDIEGWLAAHRGQ